MPFTRSKIRELRYDHLPGPRAQHGSSWAPPRARAMTRSCAVRLKCMPHLVRTAIQIRNRLNLIQIKARGEATHGNCGTGWFPLLESCHRDLAGARRGHGLLTGQNSVRRCWSPTHSPALPA